MLKRIEPYRFTGALTGLEISGGISLFFFLSSLSTAPGKFGGTFLYMLIPSMVLFGFLFDTQIIWKRMQRISKMLRPSFAGSAAFWTVVWPFCWMLADILASFAVAVQGDGFLLPPYLTSIGLNGILGFLAFPAMVRTGMGLMFYMAYRPMFVLVSALRLRLGYADEEWELTAGQEFAEFGFRK